MLLTTAIVSFKNEQTGKQQQCRALGIHEQFHKLKFVLKTVKVDYGISGVGNVLTHNAFAVTVDITSFDNYKNQ